MESCQLHEQGRVFGNYEKELLAIIHALSSWKHYLLDTPFIIQTDHQSIRYFMTQTKLFDKQMRWAIFLSQFYFCIAHIFGKHNQVVDVFSSKPRVNTISIAYHNYLTTLVDEYAIDLDFTYVMIVITMGKTQDPYKVSDGYLLHGNFLCITKI